MNILQITAAFLCGAIAGGIFFYSLWRSTKCLVLNRSSGAGFLISGIFRLAVLLSIIGFSLSKGIGFLNISAALIGFFLARIATTRWARRGVVSRDDAPSVKERAHAH